MAEVKKRSGSEKRQATVQRNLRFTPAHYDALSKMAEAQGQSMSALILNALLSIPLPRTRRPKADDKLMAQFFSELARTRDALKSSEAELGKSGSNLNQIAHVLNTDRPPERIMNLLQATMQAHQELVQEHQQAVRDLEELRTAGMNAIGLELRPGTDDE
jgi:hypothetical protein